MPTFNRPEWLRALVRYFSKTKVESTVLVLDSSSHDPGRRNRELIQTCGLRATIRSYPESVPFREKLVDGLAHVVTDFCCLCADDDLVIPPAAAECVAFLQTHPDYVGAHGWYFAFAEDRGRFFVDEILYDHPSLDAATSIERIEQLFVDYQSNFYGIYRTHAQRDALSKAARNESLLFFELGQSALTAIGGKVARLPIVYAGRRRSPSAGNPMRWHPIEWVTTDPAELVTHYLLYRALLIEQIGGPEEQRGRLSKALDLIHLRYLLTSIREPGLRAAIAAQIRADGRTEAVARAFAGSLEQPMALGGLPATRAWRLYRRAKRVISPIVEVADRASAWLESLAAGRASSLSRRHGEIDVEINRPAADRLRHGKDGLNKSIEDIYGALFLYGDASS